MKCTNTRIILLILLIAGSYESVMKRTGTKRTGLGLTKKRKKAGVSDNFHSLLNFKLKSIGITLGQKVENPENGKTIFNAKRKNVDLEIVAFDTTKANSEREILNEIRRNVFGRNFYNFEPNIECFSIVNDGKSLNFFDSNMTFSYLFNYRKNFQFKIAFTDNIPETEIIGGSGYIISKTTHENVAQVHNLLGKIENNVLTLTGILSKTINNLFKSKQGVDKDYSKFRLELRLQANNLSWTEYGIYGINIDETNPEIEFDASSLDQNLHIVQYFQSVELFSKTRGFVLISKKNTISVEKYVNQLFNQMYPLKQTKSAICYTKCSYDEEKREQNKEFEPRLRIIYEMIQNLKSLHDSGYIHRSINLNNFSIEEQDENYKKVVINDFRYLIKETEAIKKFEYIIALQKKGSGKEMLNTFKEFDRTIYKEKEGLNYDLSFKTFLPFDYYTTPIAFPKLIDSYALGISIISVAEPKVNKCISDNSYKCDITNFDKHYFNQKEPNSIIDKTGRIKTAILKTENIKTNPLKAKLIEEVFGKLIKCYEYRYDADKFFDHFTLNFKSYPIHPLSNKNESQVRPPDASNNRQSTIQRGATIRTQESLKEQQSKYKRNSTPLQKPSSTITNQVLPRIQYNNHDQNSSIDNKISLDKSYNKARDLTPIQKSSQNKINDFENKELQINEPKKISTKDKLVAKVKKGKLMEKIKKEQSISSMPKQAQINNSNNASNLKFDIRNEDSTFRPNQSKDLSLQDESRISQANKSDLSEKKDEPTRKNSSKHQMPELNIVSKKQEPGSKKI